MDNQQAIEAPTDHLHELISGFHATYHVYIGVVCGMFDALTEPQTASSLATECDLHEPYVRAFCEAGLRWKFLTVDLDVPGTDDDSPEFRLRTEFVNLLAEPESPKYMGDFFRFLGTHQADEYASYTEAFKTGQTRDTERRGPAFTMSIEESTQGIQDVFLNHLLPELSAFEACLERGGRVMDIGCGTGRLLCRLCTRFPEIEALGVDLDVDAIDRARTRAAREGVANRTTFRVQDAKNVDGPVAAAIMFMSVHEMAVETRRTLFERLSDVLTEDGVVVVFDEVYPGRYEEFDQRPFTAGVETQWAELTWGADVPTSAEHRALFAAADCEERGYRTVADRFIIHEGSKT